MSFGSLYSRRHGGWGALRAVTGVARAGGWFGFGARDESNMRSTGRGRPDLVQLTPGTGFPIVAMVSGATIGAVLASRKPRHPVGWLLLAVALSLTATGAAAQYLTWGLLVRPGALPAARWVSLYYSAIGYTAMTSIGLLLLVTPTGSLPSPSWRWLARVMVATPVLLVVAATLTRGPLDPRYEALGGPFDLRGHGGVLLVVNQLALAVTTLAVVVAAWSLVGRFRQARGVERLQLQWVALAALVVVMAGVVVLAGLAVGLASASILLSLAVRLCLAALPVATGAAVLRYGLYDLDRIISRTLAYGSLTVLLGLGYAGIVLGLGRLLPQGSSLAVAAATLAVPACSSRPEHRCGCGRPKPARAHDQGADLQVCAQVGLGLPGGQADAASNSFATMCRSCTPAAWSEASHTIGGPITAGSNSRARTARSHGGPSSARSSRC
jgi:hypothetical protein